VSCDANLNILEVIQMPNALGKMLSAATIVHCFHKDGTGPQDEHKTEHYNDVNMVKMFQSFFQKVGTGV
jgi:hypothetical protein